jgi:predicted nucleotidyltransferase
MGTSEQANKMCEKKVVNQAILNDIIHRVVEVAKPDKIILFGSAARDQMGANSDIDLLVIKSGDFHRGHLTEEIYMNLAGVGQAVDIVVTVLPWSFTPRWRKAE